MRIFLISSEPYGFPEAPLLGVFQKDLRDALVGAGHEVVVLSPSGRSLRWIGKILGGRCPKAPNGVIRNRALNVFPRCRSMEHRRFVSIGVRQFDAAVRKYGKPDIVHAHNVVYAGFLGRAISASQRVPFVLTEHSSWIVKRAYPRAFRRRISQCYRAADRVIAVSEHLKSVLQTEYDVDECEVIPNILPSEFLASKTVGPGTSVSFINVGSLDDNKNQSELIKAFARLLPAYPGISLVLVGDGPARRQLKDLANALHVENEVIFRGQISRDEVLKELQKSTALVLSSLVETFGVVAIEAMAVGLPVIATPCGGPDGLIEPGVNGLFAGGTDSEEIYQAMFEFIQNMDTFDRDGIAKNARQEYSPEEVASRTVAIYKTAQTSRGAQWKGM